MRIFAAPISAKVCCNVIISIFPPCFHIALHCGNDIVVMQCKSVLPFVLCGAVVKLPPWRQTVHRTKLYCLALRQTGRVTWPARSALASPGTVLLLSSPVFQSHRSLAAAAMTEEDINFDLTAKKKKKKKKTPFDLDGAEQQEVSSEKIKACSLNSDKKSFHTD